MPSLPPFNKHKVLSPALCGEMKTWERPLLIFTLEGRVLPFFTYNAMPIALAISLDKSTDSDHRERDRPESPDFSKIVRQRPIFRWICTHNTSIHLASHPHKSSPYFTDSILVRPTLDKSTDTESETDPNHPPVCWYPQYLQYFGYLAQC